MSRNSELEFDIQTKQVNIEKASLLLIFALREDQSLVINTNRGQFSYKQFKKLALIRKCLLAFETAEGGDYLPDSEEEFEDAEEEEKKGSAVKTVSAGVSQVDSKRRVLKMTSEKQFDLTVALKLIDSFDGKGPRTAVDDFAASVEYYSDVLSKSSNEVKRTAVKELIDFIMRIKLKGEARDLFTQPPTTIKQLCETLRERFKPEKSLPQLREELFNTRQEARSVDNYAKAIESVSNKILHLQLVGKSPELIDTVKELNEEMVLSAFLTGLDGEIKNSAIASQAKTLKDAIKVAQSAEAAFKIPKENVFAVRDNSNYRGKGTGYGGQRNNNRSRGAYQGKYSNNNNWYNHNPSSGGYNGYNNYQPRGNHYNHSYQAQPQVRNNNYNSRGYNFKEHGNAPKWGGPSENMPVNVINSTEPTRNNSVEFEQGAAGGSYEKEFFRRQY